MLRGGASLFLRSEEKSMPDWNANWGCELTVRTTCPRLLAGAFVKQAQFGGAGMPFDGTENFDNHPLAKLGAVERLLATEQQWCKGRLRDAHGRHCLVGAIEAVGGRQVLQKPVLQAAREVSGKRYWRIEFFNDDPRTTHADVLQVLRRTRENMIAGMLSAYDKQPRHQKWIRSLRALFSRRASSTRLVFPCDEPAALHAGTEGGGYVESDTRRDRVVLLELQD
ncbi:MAG: hypothetical protein WA633_19625 [Stellaceae bacterium]